MKDKKFRELDCVHEGIDSDVIRPLIFTSKGTCGNQGLVDYPFQLADSINRYVLENDLLKDAKNYQLHDYSILARECMVQQINSYLYNITFSNCMSALHCSEYNEIFNYFPIYHELTTILPNYFVRTEFYNRSQPLLTRLNILGIYQFNIMECDDKNYYQHFLNDCKVRSKLIAEYIITILFSAIDSAVNHIYNFNEIMIDKIIKLSNNDTLKKICKATPQDKYTACAIYVKQLLRDTLSEMINTTLGPAIDMVFERYIFTGSSIYSNLLDAKNKHEE